MEGSTIIGLETNAPDEVAWANFGKDLASGVPKSLAKEVSGKFNAVALENDVVAMLFPERLAEVGDGATEVFLLRGVRGGHDAPASRGVAEELGLLRHRVLFRAVVVLLVDGKDRGEPLGEDGKGLPEEEELCGG